MHLLRRMAAAIRQNWRTLRMQLAMLYAGAFAVLAAAVLAASGLLVRSGSASVNGSASSHNFFSGRPLHAGAALVFAGAALIALLLGWLIAGRFLRPLRTITATARDISASNLNRRLNLTSRDDEFTALGQTLDDLFKRLEAAFQAQRRFVANASHELRTPLTAERTLLQLALTDPDPTVPALQSACQQVLALGEQQERLIDAMLTLASSERGITQWEPFDLADITRNALTARRQQAGLRGIRISTALSTAPATGDPNLASSLTANLIDNAIRHNLDSGQAEVTTGITEGMAVLTISNTGPVIPPADVDRLFQPFQRLGAERATHTDGHGFGLAIVRAIADAHGATLTTKAHPDGGLTIEVSFPQPPGAGH